MYRHVNTESTFWQGGSSSASPPLTFALSGSQKVLSTHATSDRVSTVFYLWYFRVTQLRERLFRPVQEFTALETRTGDTAHTRGGWMSEICPPPQMELDSDEAFEDVPGENGIEFRYSPTRAQTKAEIRVRWARGLRFVVQYLGKPKIADWGTQVVQHRTSRRPYGGNAKPDIRRQSEAG
ncbi:hypothetical protein K466DRAFT_211853 [Polyporus arcularius HHB13444]|uniref:Uncharacterized protein n=1 Tax=Polyporus arcularius HHB13444 TaxID=1314778 RepID=A0A5C3PVY0_9APHY|nr:hypothetical protein K466DRAFT_211853 [Polyporus arcularius HHB13444]